MDPTSASESTSLQFQAMIRSIALTPRKNYLTRKSVDNGHRTLIFDGFHEHPEQERKRLIAGMFEFVSATRFAFFKLW